MSEAAAGGGTRAEIERRLIQRSMEDEDFRQKLLDEPKAAVGPAAAGRRVRSTPVIREAVKNAIDDLRAS